MFKAPEECLRLLEPFLVLLAVLALATVLVFISRFGVSHGSFAIAHRMFKAPGAFFGLLAVLALATVLVFTSRFALNHSSFAIVQD